MKAMKFLYITFLWNVIETVNRQVKDLIRKPRHLKPNPLSILCHHPTTLGRWCHL